MKQSKLVLIFSLLLIGLASCDPDEVVNETEQLAIDDAIMRDYLTQEGLLGQARLDTASNIYYVIQSEGTGASPSFGQTVFAHYEGYLLSGELFDSSETPYEFVLGRGEVILGWEVGFGLLNKGTRARLLIPSGLAYGARGTSTNSGVTIGPNTVIMFDVNLVDIR